MAEVSLGDHVSTFGMGKDANYVRGFMSRRHSTAQHGAAWQGPKAVIIDADELMFDGQQHEGMSGASTLNGCGYVGMAHAMTENGPRTYYNVIRASHVHDCIRANVVRLNTVDQCPRKVVQPPVFSWCHKTT